MSYIELARQSGIKHFLGWNTFSLQNEQGIFYNLWLPPANKYGRDILIYTQKEWEAVSDIPLIALLHLDAVAADAIHTIAVGEYAWHNEQKLRDAHPAYFKNIMEYRRVTFQNKDVKRGIALISIKDRTGTMLLHFDGCKWKPIKDLTLNEIVALRCVVLDAIKSESK